MGSAPVRQPRHRAVVPHLLPPAQSPVTSYKSQVKSVDTHEWASCSVRQPRHRAVMPHLLPPAQSQVTSHKSRVWTLMSGPVVSEGQGLGYIVHCTRRTTSAIYHGPHDPVCSQTGTAARLAQRGVETRGGPHLWPGMGHSGTSAPPQVDGDVLGQYPPLQLPHLHTPRKKEEKKKAP